MRDTVREIAYEGLRVGGFSKHVAVRAATNYRLINRVETAKLSYRNGEYRGHDI